MDDTEGKEMTGMQKETVGTVIADTKLWWCKINRKAVRMHALDGADFPHLIRVRYVAEGREYVVRKLIGTSRTCPQVGQTVTVYYQSERPSKCSIV